jgi:hypothetical protein
MSNPLENGRTPEAWSSKLKAHGVHVSARLIRAKARQTGHSTKLVG